MIAASMSGCGYVGEPLPPALKRPTPVSDLSAVERGAKIIIQFTPPKVTTEGLPIKGPQDVELRIGPANSDPFRPDTWVKEADLFPVPALAEPRTSVEIPAARYYNKTVFIGLRVHGPHGREAGWSNFRVLPIVPALGTPAGLEAANAPDAVRLDWHDAAPEFRIFRRLPGAETWTQLATSNKPTYLDGSIEYGNTYQYFVQAIERTGETYAESDASETITFKPADQFPPAVPAGLTAVPGTRSIELVWERSPEKDFSSYRVYRDGIRVGEGLGAPAFSDTTVQTGVKYRYQVSAVDTTGLESAKTAPVEAEIP